MADALSIVMNARAHFFLRAAALAVLVVEAAYPRAGRSVSVAPVAITAAPTASADPLPTATPAVVATR